MVSEGSHSISFCMYGGMHPIPTPPPRAQQWNLQHSASLDLAALCTRHCRGGGAPSLPRLCLGMKVIHVLTRRLVDIPTCNHHGRQLIRNYYFFSFFPKQISIWPHTKRWYKSYFNHCSEMDWTDTAAPPHLNTLYRTFAYSISEAGKLPEEV